MAGLRKLTNWAELDLRSLSIFRILLGLCLCEDLFQKLIYAKELYSDWGLMPRIYWMSEYMNEWKISLLLANGEPWFQYLFVFVALVCALCFTLGYKTRISQILLLILVGSIQSRNYLVLSCADDLMRVALFWSILLPLDRHYSIGRNSISLSNQEGQKIRSIGTGLLILQLVIMYLITACYKINPVWTTEHSAIYYALNIDHFTTPLGHWLKQFEEFGKLLTQTTLIWEFVGPLLLFVPVFSRTIKTFVAVGFIFFHFGLALCLNLGTFPWVAIAYWTIFLPGDLWDFLLQKAKQILPIQLPLFFREFRAHESIKVLRVLSSRNRRIINCLFASLMALVIYQNLADLNNEKVPFPSPLRHVLYALNMNQVWDMFAPYPIRNDGWFVVQGNFKNGETRDLITGKAVTYEKPELISDLYASSEWRKFYLNLWNDGDTRILLPYARYLCRSQASQDGSSALVTLKITFMKKTTPPMGMSFPPIEPVQLWSHDCFTN